MRLVYTTNTEDELSANNLQASLYSRLGDEILSRLVQTNQHPLLKPHYRQRQKRTLSIL